MKFAKPLTSRSDSSNNTSGSSSSGLANPGIESRCGAGFSAPVQNGSGSHSASCTKGTGCNGPGRGVNNSPTPTPSSTEFKEIVVTQRTFQARSTVNFTLAVVAIAAVAVDVAVVVEAVLLVVVVAVVVVIVVVVMVVMNTETPTGSSGTVSRLTQRQRKPKYDFVLCRYLNVSLNSRVQHDLWNVMSALAQCQYPFYFRMQSHLEESSHILPQLAGLNVSHFMLQVLQCSLLDTAL